MKLKITKAVLYLLAAAVAVLFILQVGRGGTPLLMAACGVLVLYLIVYALFWRCPHCGKHLGKDLNVRKCRHCGEKLDI